MNDFFKNNAKDIAMALVFLVGLYFTIKSNTEDIEMLKLKDAEIENNKVSKSAMDLKEHFLNSELQRMGAEFTDINTRLDKKIKIINSQNNEIITLRIKVATMQTEMNQVRAELKNVWSNYNRINCK